MATTTTSGKKRLHFDCTEMSCLLLLDLTGVQVNKRDLKRLARYFGVSEETAAAQHTKMYKQERILRRKKDPIFGLACKFLDPQTRRCTIYDECRPAVAAEYPDSTHCAYYTLLRVRRESTG